MLDALKMLPPEREARLREIYRFSMFDTLFYRSNLWMHSHRVFWLADAILPTAQKYLKLDPEKTKYLALVHDDAEVITGDIQAGLKARMSSEELARIDQDEELAVNELAERYPTHIGKYLYKDLLMHALNKDCPEAQLVSYLDKVDAYCESMHEILAGNITLLRSVVFYTRTLGHFSKKFPELKELISSPHSPFTYLDDVLFPDHVYTQRYTHLNKPHTRESIQTDTDFPFYNAWRKTIVEKGGDEGIRWLTEQREFIALS